MPTAVETRPRRPLPPPPEWFGEWTIGEGWARFFGRVGSAQVAACASAQVIAAICSWNRLSVAGSGSRALAGAIVRSGESCRIDPERPHVMILFADARLPLGVLIEDEIIGSLHRLSYARAARWRRVLFGLVPETPMASAVQVAPVSRRGPHPMSVMHPDAATARTNWSRIAEVMRLTQGRMALADASRRAGFVSVTQCSQALVQLIGLTPAVLGLDMYGPANRRA